MNYVHDNVGYNYRLTNIQAALGCAQLEKLESYIEIKRKNFGLYQKLLSKLFSKFSGFSLITEPEYSFSNYWFYSLLTDPGVIEKSELITRLKTMGIESRPLWYPNHLQKPYRKEPRCPMKKTMRYFERVVNIPCSVNLTDADIRFVCESIIEKVG
mgnify:FL=1